MSVSCSREPGAIPELDEHPDDADGLIRAADRPRRLAVVGLHPDMLIHQGVVVDVEVGGSVLEAQQVSRSRGLRRLARTDASGVPVDHPAQGQVASGAAHQLAQRELHGVVVPGLEDDRDVAVRQLRVQPVVGQERHGVQFLGLAIGQTEPVVEERGPDADEHGQVVGGRLLAEDSRVDGRIGRIAGFRRLARHQPADLVGELLQRRLQSCAVPRRAG